MVDYVLVIKGIMLQVIFFSVIPFLYWVLRKRKEKLFLPYVGLYKPRRTAATKSVVIFIIIYLVIYAIVHFTPIALITQPSAGRYAGLGAAAIIPAFLVSFLQQALAEEILFRGFIGKRLIAKLGLFSGNICQAVIFGLMHVLLSVSDEKTFLAYFIIFVSISAGGWLLGFLDEKLCNGSIVPSILLHGFGNFIMVLSVAF